MSLSRAQSHPSGTADAREPTRRFLIVIPVRIPVRGPNLDAQNQMKIMSAISCNCFCASHAA